MVFRSRQGFATVFVASLGALGAVFAPADSHSQTFREEATARGVTVTTRPRPEYDPVGVRLGAFRLDAAAELGLGYDDNVFGRKDNRTGDGYFTNGGSASLVSGWTRHAVGVSGFVEDRRYFSETGLSTTDWGVNTFGRYDFDAQTSLEARYTHQRSHLDVYSVDVQQAGLTRPAPFDTDEFQVTGTTWFNRLALTGIGTYRMVRYEDLDVGGVRQQLSRNDYNSWLGALGAAYAISPGRLVTLIGRLQDISYDDRSQRGRDSFTWEALVGFQYDFDGVWQARGGIGYIQRSFSSPTLKNVEGVAFEGQVIWAATQLTTLSMGVRRSIEVSITESNASYTRSLVNANVDHELLRNVILGAELGVSYSDYQTTNVDSTDGYAVLSARWLLNRNMALTASYQYSTRFQGSSTLEEYYRNLVQVRLRFAL
jgi:hypothetical protein